MNPILHRELKVAGRRRVTYFVRGGTALGMTLAIVLVLLAVGIGRSDASGLQIGREMESAASSLSFTVLWLAFGVLSLLGPALTAGAIADERRARTLSALAASPLTPSQIVLGKLASRMYEAVILLLIITPTLLAVRIYGGIEGETVLAFVALSLLAALLGGMIGLVYSTWHSSSTSAVSYAVATLGLLFAAPPITAGVARSYSFWGLASRGVPQSWLDGLFAAGLVVSPPVILVLESVGQPMPMSVSGVPNWLLEHPWMMTAAAMLVLSAGLFGFASWSLGRRLSVDAVSTSSAASKSVRGESKRLRGLGDRPVLWRELTRPIFARSWQKFAILGFATIGIGFAYFRIGMDEPALHMMMGLVGILGITLLASVSTTSSISTEREAQTWEVLLTTPMSPSEIITSKFAAAARRMMLPIGLLTVHFVIAGMLGHLLRYAVLVVPMMCAAAAVFYLATGVLFSLMFRKAIVASVCNALLLIAIWMVVPILLMIIIGIIESRTGWDSEAVARVIFAGHPVMLVQAALSDATGYLALNEDSEIDFLDQNISIVSFMLIVLACFLVHLAAAWGVLRYAVRIFHKKTGRSS